VGLLSLRGTAVHLHVILGLLARSCTQAAAGVLSELQQAAALLAMHVICAAP
jgi:hypothetical protein